MMFCILRGHSHIYDIQTVTQIFFPNEPFTLVDSVAEKGVTVVSSPESGQVYTDGILRESHVSDDKNPRRQLMMSVFMACKAFTGLKTPWGALTGIRPSKMVRLMMEEGMKPVDVINTTTQIYGAQREKIQLAVDVALAEQKILQAQRPNGYSLYAGVPFCPTRCLYCSFASFPLGAYADRIDDYLAALSRELVAIAGITQGRPLESLYVGGGTPTALPERQLGGLLEQIVKRFPIDGALEFSVEAGRPDTISREKLRLLKSFGVGRISVNPQTLHDETLRRIGRRHSAESFFRAFAMAREEGFDNINTDIILGLPGETPMHTARTLDGIRQLRPESLTVHTLTVKRASQLREAVAEFPADALEEMLLISRQAAAGMGMIPYYMYRQKNMLGNFENVGYCLPGRESFYNVYIMEETHDIWAAGAGATSKLVDGKKIRRIFNVKNLDDYINRIDEMILRKGEASLC